MRDKVLHFIAGAAISAPITFAGYPVHAVIIAGLAAIAKEVWDTFGNGTPELADFISTVIGAAMMTACLA